MRPVPALIVGLACGCGTDTPQSAVDTTDTAVPTTPPPSAQAIRTGSQASGRFGISVVTFGDRDGDGVANWAAAASAVGTQRQGAAWAGSGLPTGTLAVSADMALISGQRDIERLGQAMAAPGDLDGDGWPELVLGAIHLGDPMMMHGGVRVLWGDGSQSEILGEGMMEHAGWAVAGGGENSTRLLVGTPYRRTGDGQLDTRGFPATPGRVYVLDQFGSGSLSDASEAIIEGTVSWAAFGAAVAGGDLNQDGIDDVIVGIPNGATDTDRIGRVAWFEGPVSGSLTVDDRSGIWEGESGDHLGFALAADGDLDGDGYPELAMGAYKAGEARDDAGAAVVVDGATLRVTGRIQSGQREALAGVAVSYRPLSSGRAELLIGTPGWSVGGQRAGAVLRHRGPVDGRFVADPDLVLPSPREQAEFGTSIASHHDLNGDGVVDLLVGAPSWTTDGGKTGAVLFFAGSEL